MASSTREGFLDDGQHTTLTVNALIDDTGARRFTSLCGLLCTPFCLGQILFNLIASFGGPLVCFYLIFTSMGPESWDGAPMIGIALASPFACALCSLAFIPVGIPDAAAHGWFGIIEPHSVACLLRAMPFLRCRIGAVRHLCVGCVVGVLWIPTVYYLARFVEGPVMSARTFVFFGPACIAALPLLVLPLGLLGFALPDNYARIEAIMASTVREGPIVKLIRRGLLAPTC